MIRAVRILFVLFTLGVLAALAGGYLGALHPAGDSLAVFRAYLVGPVLLLAVLALVLRMRVVAALSGVCGVLALISVWGLLPLGDPPLKANYALYQKNMAFRNANPGLISADILTRRPSFVTLQEVSEKNSVVLDSIRTEYPAQHICAFSGVGGVAVAARRPMVEGSGKCSDQGRGIAAMQVQTRDGPVWVVSVHLYWPWPHSQDAQVTRILPLLRALEGPMVIGGDFNMVPWSHTLRAVELATGTKPLGPAKVTLVKAGGLLRVPIDHVLVPHDKVGGVKYLPLLGSDHYGVWGEFE